MAQQDNRRGGPRDERDEDRGPARSQQSSFSDRDEQMGGYYTGAGRNFGAGQGNYGSGGSPDDWGRGPSGGGTDWRNAPGGYGRDSADGGRAMPGAADPGRGQGGQGGQR